MVEIAQDTSKKKVDEFSSIKQPIYSILLNVTKIKEQWITVINLMEVSVFSLHFNVANCTFSVYNTKTQPVYYLEFIYID